VVGFGTKGNATTIADFFAAGVAGKKIIDLGGALEAI
jgi:hypothetical protein